MSNQIKVTAVARKTDVETSHEAAATIDVQKHADYVLRALYNLYIHPLQGKLPFTAGQAVDNLANVDGAVISPSGVRSRIKELRDNGYIQWATYPGGEQAYKVGTNKRRSRLMRLTAKGVLTVQQEQNVIIERNMKPQRMTYTLPFDTWNQTDEELGEQVAKLLPMFSSGELVIEVLPHG